MARMAATARISAIAAVHCASIFQWNDWTNLSCFTGHSSPFDGETETLGCLWPLVNLAAVLALVQPRSCTNAARSNRYSLTLTPRVSEFPFSFAACYLRRLRGKQACL